VTATFVSEPLGNFPDRLDLEGLKLRHPEFRSVELAPLRAAFSWLQDTQTAYGRWEWHSLESLCARANVTPGALRAAALLANVRQRGTGDQTLFKLPPLNGLAGPAQ
jgi:hypothetical protein